MASSAVWFDPAGDPSGEQSSLRRYLETVKARWLFVVLVVAVATAAAGAYALTARKMYEAEADMLVTPVPDDQTVILGLGLLRRATDPTRDVTTASRLIDNAQVAARVRRDLRVSAPPEALLGQISVSPVAQSSIVAITASSPSPRQAQRLANGFGRAAVADRTDQLHAELVPAIRNMRARIRQITGGGTPATANAATQPLFQQLAAMEALRSAPDPTLRLETPAVLPTSPASPRVGLTIAGGLVAGLLLGIAGAFLLTALDPRRRRQQGLDAMGLSILTRVPELGRSGHARHAFDESFRLLRTMLRFAGRDRSTLTLAVTSAAEKEGKTTTSFQLAMATLEAGQTVLLVEADPYRPGLRPLIETETNGAPAPGLLDYLSGTATLDEAIESTMMPGLTFLPAGSLQSRSVTGLLEKARGRSFVRELSARADVVILDCPPVGPRSDAVLVASYADSVLLVVDVAQSSEREVFDAVARLERARADIVGIVLNRDESAAASYEYGELGEQRSPRVSVGRAIPFRR